MTLEQWMAAEGLGVREAARRIGKNHSEVSRLLGGQDPRVSTALRIERATGGAVTLYDWPEEPVELAERLRAVLPKKRKPKKES